MKKLRTPWDMNWTTRLRAVCSRVAVAVRTVRGIRLMVGTLGSFVTGCAYDGAALQLSAVRPGFSYCPNQRHGHAERWLVIEGSEKIGRAQFERVRIRGRGVRHAYSADRTVVVNRRSETSQRSAGASRYRSRFDHPPRVVPATSIFGLLPLPAERKYRANVRVRRDDGDKTRLRVRFSSGPPTYVADCGTSSADAK